MQYYDFIVTNREAMSDFLKMDVFFVVSTVAVVIVGVLFCIALFYVIRILRTADRISEEFADEAHLVRADIRDMRASVRAEGFKWRHVSGLFRRLLTGRSKRD
jgi:hypothetical protein